MQNLPERLLHMPFLHLQALHNLLEPSLVWGLTLCPIMGHTVPEGGFPWPPGPPPVGTALPPDPSPSPLPVLTLSFHSRTRFCSVHSPGSTHCCPGPCQPPAHVCFAHPRRPLPTCLHVGFLLVLHIPSARVSKSLGRLSWSSGLAEL